MDPKADAAHAANLIEQLPDDIRPLALRTLECYSRRDPHTGPFGWRLGLHYLERKSGQVACAIDIDRSLYNPGNIAHGGVVFTLADSAMGAAVFMMLGPGQRSVTAELKLNYLAPVTSGTVTATANVVKKGKRLAVVTAEVRDDRDRLIGLAQGTFAIVDVAEQRPVEGDS